MGPESPCLLAKAPVLMSFMSTDAILHSIMFCPEMFLLAGTGGWDSICYNALNN